MYRTILAVLFLVAVTITVIAFRVAVISNINARNLETLELTR